MDTTLFPMITDDEIRLPFVVMSIGVRENQEHILRPDGYPCFHWLHSSSGTGRLIIGGGEYVIEEGMGFFFEKSIPHEYYAVQEPWETRWITFDGYAVPELLGLLGFKPWNVFRLKGRLQLEKILQDIYSTGISRNIGRNYECSSLLYQFLLNAGNSMGRDSGKAARSLNRQLQSVLLFIDESYGKPVSLDNMAEKAEISKQHLCRLFRQAFNMSPFEYLTRYRIQKAKEYILLPGGPKLKEVAAAVGYNDASYFCAVFRELEGLTPSQFKNMYRMP